MIFKVILKIITVLFDLVIVVGLSYWVYWGYNEPDWTVVFPCVLVSLFLEFILILGVRFVFEMINDMD